MPPVVFTLESKAAERVENTMAEHSVVGVYSAHTHRNKVTSSPRTPGVPFIEVGAVKEYPGGYSLVEVYEGGYMVNFHKTRADESRAWSERSRGEYLGLYPYYTLGTLAERNFVISADFSDAATAPTSVPQTGASPGGPSVEAPAGTAPAGRSLPATGGNGDRLAAGAIAAAGALAVRKAIRTAGEPAAVEHSD